MCSLAITILYAWVMLVLNRSFKAVMFLTLMRPSLVLFMFLFFFSSRRRHTRLQGDEFRRVLFRSHGKGKQEIGHRQQARLVFFHPRAGLGMAAPGTGPMVTGLISVVRLSALAAVELSAAHGRQIGRASCRERV